MNKNFVTEFDKFEQYVLSNLFGGESISPIETAETLKEVLSRVHFKDEREKSIVNEFLKALGWHEDKIRELSRRN